MLTIAGGIVLATLAIFCIIGVLALICYFLNASGDDKKK